MYRKPWPRPDQAKAQPNPAQAKALAFGLACDIGKPKPFKARPKPSHLAWPVILESPSPSKPGQSPQSQPKPGPNNTTWRSLRASLSRSFSMTCWLSTHLEVSATNSLIPLSTVGWRFRSNWMTLHADLGDMVPPWIGDRRLICESSSPPNL